MRKTKGSMVKVVKLLRHGLLGGFLLIGAGANGQDYFRTFGTSRTSSGIGLLSPTNEVFLGNTETGQGLQFSNVVEPGQYAPVSGDSVDRYSESEQQNYNFRIGQLEFIVAAGLGSNSTTTSRFRTRTAFRTLSCVPA
jgi:hypothetical protein